MERKAFAGLALGVLRANMVATESINMVTEAKGLKSGRSYPGGITLM